MSRALSVVVVCQDVGDRLRALLDSLDAARPGPGVEVIVVDDGSERPLAASLPARGYWPRTFLRRERGQASRAAARNLGAAAAGGEVLVFLDADQVAPPALLGEHLRYHEQAGRAVVVGFRRHATDGTRGCRPEVRTRVTSVLSQNFAAVAGAWYLTFTCNVSADGFLVRRRDQSTR